VLAALFLAGAPLAASAQNVSSAARDLASSCAMCHEARGAPSPATGGAKALAGESAESIARRLREFRDGERPATIMQQIAKGYSDSQIDALAAYFASRK